MRKYKLLLVDDEEEVRKGVLRKMEWEKLGFEVIGEAENGREALETFEKTVPDIILSDIKMPFMDGLQLAEAVKTKFPNTKIIMITGFDEFEYAHKAIKLNVTEYVLKPISSQELTQVLIKVRTQLDEETAAKENIDALKAHYQKSLPILREKFLTALITNTLETEEIQEKAQSYEIDLHGNYFTTAVITMVHGKETLNLGAEEALPQDRNRKLWEDPELLKFAVLNIVEDIIGKRDFGHVFLHLDQIIILAVSKEAEEETAIDSIFDVLEEIRQSITKYLKLKITIGLGSVFDDVCYMSRSYQGAVAALSYRLFIGADRIIWIEDIEPHRVEKIVFDDAKEHALTSAVKVGTAEEISSTVNTLFEEMKEVKASFKEYQIYLMEMLTAILKAARNAGVDTTPLLGNNSNLLTELLRFESIERAQEWFTNISVQVMKAIVRDRQNASSHLVQRATDFIKANYSNSDLTVNEICNYLHISPTYFSFIFKKETKSTFVNYLTQVRMEAAKELLRTTDLKSFEIAEKVGYGDPNYFSYSFKKKYGMSPSEYRNGF